MNYDSDIDLNGWIPASKPPHKPMCCLIIDSGGDMSMGGYDGKEFMVDSLPKKRDALYWRPMPKYPTKTGEYEPR